MTDEELIAMARLAQRDERKSTGALYGHLASRIEALTAERDMATEGWAEATRLIDVARQQYGAEKSRAEAAEAKLAKAMSIAKRVTCFEDTTEELAECGCARCKAHLKLRATLAEIEGSDAP